MTGGRAGAAPKSACQPSSRVIWLRTSRGGRALPAPCDPGATGRRPARPSLTTTFTNCIRSWPMLSQAVPGGRGAENGGSVNGALYRLCSCAFSHLDFRARC
jgi:hypothetical protein